MDEMETLILIFSRSGFRLKRHLRCDAAHQGQIFFFFFFEGSWIDKIGGSHEGVGQTTTVTEGDQRPEQRAAQQIVKASTETPNLCRRAARHQAGVLMNSWILRLILRIFFHLVPVCRRLSRLLQGKCCAKRLPANAVQFVWIILCHLCKVVRTLHCLPYLCVCTRCACACVGVAIYDFSRSSRKRRPWSGLKTRKASI